jgi:hypothetical protein
MNEGNRTPDLTTEDIMEIAKDFPTLAIKVVVGGDITIKSRKDTWMVIDEGRFFTLYHSGISINNGKYKERYHLQDVFKDLNYIFASVVTHDDYAMGIQKRNPNELLEMLQ